jgi:hypothetical protein
MKPLPGNAPRWTGSPTPHEGEMLTQPDWQLELLEDQVHDCDGILGTHGLAERWTQMTALS